MTDRSARAFRWTAAWVVGVAFAAGVSAPAGDGEGWDDKLKQAQSKIKAAEEERQLRGEIHFKAGMEHFKEARYVQAQAELQKAVSLGHVEAQEHLQKVNAILDVSNDKFKTALDDLRRMHGAQVDMILFEIDRGFQEGDAFLRQGQYENAIRVYEKVRTQIRFLPMEVPNRETKLSRVDAALKEARGSYDKERSKDDEQKRKLAQQLIEDAEARKQDLARKRIEKMLLDAEEAYAREEFDYAVRLSDRILQEEPANLSAKDLKRRARAARYEHRKSSNQVETAHRLRQVDLFAEDLQVPADPTMAVEFPSNWLSVRAEREAKGQGLSFIEEEPWKKAVREKLKGRIGPYDQAGSTMNDILAMIEKKAGVTIHIDKAIEADLQNQTIATFKDLVGDASVEMVLNRLVDIFQYKWTLKYGGVYITTKEGFFGEMVFRFLDVKDLLVKPKDFTAPNTGFAQTAGGGLGGDEEESEDQPLELSDIVDLIKTNVSEIEEAGGAVEPVEKTGQISVKAPVELHAKVGEVLKGLRSQQSMLVDIHARFLRVETDLVDDLGVSWQGLVGRTVTGTTASSGILNEPGKMNDVRFLQPGSGTVHSQFLGDSFRIGGTAKSQRADNASSLLQYSYLNDWQASMVLRAVHMTRKGSIVHAPHLKCFNTQRAYMVVIREEAYIRDVATLVSSGIGGAAGIDPEVGTIRSGTSFEVRPVVSADRKFITLELKPTQAEVIAFRNIDVQSALNNTNSSRTPIYIEAPQLELRQVRTTVSVPDNATILLGGLTAYSKQHQYNGIPGISKIPILNFFFGRDADVQEKNSLLIMVRAMIVDNQEEEERQFGRR